MKEKIDFWYKHKFWTADMVQDAVDKGILKPEEAAEILGA